MYAYKLHSRPTVKRADSFEVFLFDCDPCGLVAGKLNGADGGAPLGQLLVPVGQH